MANTYTLIASSTVGSGGAANITFSSIPSTYTDLKVTHCLRSNRATDPNDWVYVSFNSSTSNFSAIILGGSGTTYSYSGFPRVFGIATASGATASTFGNSDIYVPNYTSSNYKSWSSDQVSENNGATAYSELVAGLWSDTSAITSIILTPRVGSSFDEYSTAYLYGIKNS